MTEQPGNRADLDYDPAEDQDTEPSSPTPPTEQADTSSTELHVEGNEG